MIVVDRSSLRDWRDRQNLWRVADKRRFAEESLWADVMFTSTSTFYDLTNLYKLKAKQRTRRGARLRERDRRVSRPRRPKRLQSCVLEATPPAGNSSPTPAS